MEDTSPTQMLQYYSLLDDAKLNFNFLNYYIIYVAIATVTLIMLRIISYKFGLVDGKYCKKYLYTS